MWAFAIVATLFLQPAASFVDLTRHASLVFSGTVEKSHSATRGIPAGDDTVVVRVEDVLVQPAELIPLKGELVTVRFRGAEKAPETKSRRLFFTNIYLAGDTVGVDIEPVGAGSGCTV